MPGWLIGLSKHHSSSPLLSFPLVACSSPDYDCYYTNPSATNNSIIYTNLTIIASCLTFNRHWKLAPLLHILHRTLSRLPALGFPLQNLPLLSAFSRHPHIRHRLFYSWYTDRPFQAVSRDSFFSSFLSFSLLCRPRQSKSREPSSHPDRVKLVFGLLYLPLFIFRFLKFPHSPLVESHSFLQSYIPGTHPGKVRIRYIKPKKKQARYTRQIAFQASMDRSCAPEL